MNQQNQSHPHTLRDKLGTALGILCAFFWVVPAHEHSVDVFIKQIKPLLPYGHEFIMSIIWGVCLFYLLVVGVRFVVVTAIGMLTTLLSIIAVRLSLSRRRGS